MVKVTRQSRKKTNTHNSLMHAAKELFEKKGLGNATINEITELADMSRSTFFSHFNSTETLTSELAELAIQEILDVYIRSNKHGIEGLTVLCNKLIDDTCPYPHLSAELLMGGIVNSNDNSTFSVFLEVLEKELDNSNIPENLLNRSEQVALLVGTYFGLISQRLIKGQKFVPLEIKKTMYKIINQLGGENE